VEEAVNRKVQEEIGTTSLNSLRLLGVYSHPERDDRRHTVSAVYVGKVHGKFKAGDDAKVVSVIPLQAMNVELIRLSFDHNHILKDYWYALKETVVERNLMPRQGTSLCPAPRKDEDQE
jgi:8-oxo-dGTP diphosphatase